MEKELKKKILINICKDLAKKRYSNQDKHDIIRSLHNLGMSYRDIKEETGTAFSTISVAITGTAGGRWEMNIHKILIYLKKKKEFDMADIEMLIKVKNKIEEIIQGK